MECLGDGIQSAVKEDSSVRVVLDQSTITSESCDYGSEMKRHCSVEPMVDKVTENKTSKQSAQKYELVIGASLVSDDACDDVTIIKPVQVCEPSTMKLAAQQLLKQMQQLVSGNDKMLKQLMKERTQLAEGRSQLMRERVSVEDDESDDVTGDSLQFGDGVAEQHVRDSCDSCDSTQCSGGESQYQVIEWNNDFVQDQSTDSTSEISNLYSCDINYANVCIVPNECVSVTEYVTSTFVCETVYTECSCVSSGCRNCVFCGNINTNCSSIGTIGKDSILYENMNYDWSCITSESNSINYVIL